MSSSAPTKGRQSCRRTRRLVLESLENREVFAADFDSVLGIGGDDATGSSTVQAVETDLVGNTYTTGRFSGTVDFDPGVGESIRVARGVHDIFVAKYHPGGALNWVQQLGGDESSPGGTDSGLGIAVGNSGSVYVSGRFQSFTQIGSFVFTSTAFSGGFVTKLDASGNVAWAKQTESIAVSVGVDASENVVVLSESKQINIVKYSSSGSLTWSKSIASNDSLGSNLAVDAPGNVFVHGTFRGTVDFDPSSRTRFVSSGPSHSSFTLKLDSKGGFKWVSPFVGQSIGGSSGSSRSGDIGLDASGNILVGGFFQGTVDFNPSTAVTTLSNLSVSSGSYVTKLNSSGGLVWAKALSPTLNSSTFLGNSGIYLGGLDVDSTGNVYVVGDFSGTVDFNPGSAVELRSSSSPRNGFVVKLNAAGDFVWVETLAGEGNSYFADVSVDAAGMLQLGGNYSGNVDFDPNPLSNETLPSGPMRRGFLLRLRQR